MEKNVIVSFLPFWIHEYLVHSRWFKINVSCCTEQPCPGKCTSSKHGKCNTKTGVCNCNKPYYGEKCDSKFITVLNSRIVDRNSRLF